MLKFLKTMAILILIAIISVAVVVFGAFIGAVMLFLGSVFVIGVFIYIFWLTYKEHQESK